MKRSTALFFSESHLQLARDHIDREPISGALRLLDNRPADRLEAAQLLALKYVFRHDSFAGDAAIELLREQDFSSDAGFAAPALKRRLGWLAVMAMLQGHPRSRSLEDASLGPIESAVQQSLQSGSDTCPLQLSWQAALAMASGILADDDAIFERAAALFRRLVDDHIHPEGYFKGVVDIDGASETYAAQFSATCAMVLMAEMAGQAGVDLWNYDNRAVSVNTAATYTFYYYFFPERWRWESGLRREKTMTLMRREGAYFEMLNRRSPLRGVDQLFAEQRPMFAATGGGLTTLTHGLAPPKKKRWGIF